MKLPGQIYAMRKIVFDVEEVRALMSEHYGRPATDQDVLAYINETAYDEFGTRNFSLYNPEQDRDIS